MDPLTNPFKPPFTPHTHPHSSPLRYQEFEAKLVSALPMVVGLGGLGCAKTMRPDGPLLPPGVAAKILSPTKLRADEKEDEEEEVDGGGKKEAASAKKRPGPMDSFLGKPKV